MLVNAPDELKQGLAARREGDGRRRGAAGAMIEGMERMGFDLTHVYGLTEVYGPATVCAKHDEWDDARHRRARAPERAARACATTCRTA